MRISNAYPDALIGCTMFPENAETDEFGFGVDVAAKGPRVASGLDEPLPKSGLDEPLPKSGLDEPLPGSGLDAPAPPPLDPNNPADALKVRSGL